MSVSPALLLSVSLLSVLSLQLIALLVLLVRSRVRGMPTGKLHTTS
jgi:hypothetical protein